MTENIMEVVRRYQIDPKRSLGQNFLIDASHLDRIAAAADLARTDTVLEIGPGVGTLTRRLAAQAGYVVAVELDDRLIELLRVDFGGQSHVQIVHGDILEIEPPALLAALERNDVEMRRQALQVIQSILKRPVAFDPYAPAAQRRQQLQALRETHERKAG